MLIVFCCGLVALCVLPLNLLLAQLTRIRRGVTVQNTVACHASDSCLPVFTARNICEEMGVISLLWSFAYQYPCLWVECLDLFDC
jgi:hypothetical protein